MTGSPERASGWLLEFEDGPVAYAETWSLQRELLRARQEGLIPDVLLLLEHRPVVTLGRSAAREHLLVSRAALAARGIEVFDVERGGSATYHGPGQLVGYPIVDLRRLGDDVSAYVRTLEAVVMDTLAACGIPATRRPGYPGVWVGEAKICALGVAVKRHVTMHGFALNVNTDLDGFAVINPCGLGRPVTSMARWLGRPVDLATVRRVCADRIAHHFRLRLERTSLEAVRRTLAAAPAGA
jgi:lipoate-protein ligase B